MMRRIAAIALITLAVMLSAYMMQGPVTSARADASDDPIEVRLGWKCPGGGLGCYYCSGNPSPGGTGCDNGSIGAWSWGECQLGVHGDACSKATQSRGDARTCTTNKKIGECWTLPICINP